MRLTAKQIDYIEGLTARGQPQTIEIPRAALAELVRLARIGTSVEAEVADMHQNILARPDNNSHVSHVDYEFSEIQK